MPLKIVEGWTEPLDFTIKVNGAPALLTTQDVVTLILKDKRGALISTTGEVEVRSSSTGAVRWAPSARDLQVSREPYMARFKIVGPSCFVFYAPSGEPDKWTVYAP